MKLFNPLIDRGYIPNSKYGRGGVRRLSPPLPNKEKNIMKLNHTTTGAVI